MLQNSSVQLLGVTDKKDGNGIGDNVSCKFMMYVYESSLKPCSYHKPVKCQNMVSTILIE